MATASPELFDKKLTLLELIDHVPIGQKWKQLGINLEIEYRELETMDKSDLHEDKVSKMFQTWLDGNPNASRQNMLEALKKPNVNEKTIAAAYEKWILAKRGGNQDTQDGGVNRTESDKRTPKPYDDRGTQPENKVSPDCGGNQDTQDGRVNHTESDKRTPSPKSSPSEVSNVPRIEINLEGSGNIAAIDFGTTSVSLAYTLRGNEEIKMLFLDSEDQQSTRVSNIVLLKKTEKEMVVDAFGEVARNKFTNLRSCNKPMYVYFERMKMLLRREKTIDRQTLVMSYSGDSYYLVEVIALILKYLKNLLINHLSQNVKATDFDWVITVPAIWNAQGKQLMREAAYLAGLLTESGGITQFTTPSDLPLGCPTEANPERLSLALEPESAALYSQIVVGEQIDGDSSIAAIRRPSEYMVIDIGGGTVDITAHTEIKGEIIVSNIPTGNAWGGTKVNEAFSEMLQEIVHDPEFSRFLPSPLEKKEEYAQHMGILNKIVFKEFEGEKRLFGRCGVDEEISVSLPHGFFMFYYVTLNALARKKDGIECVNGDLKIEKQVVEDRLFGPALKGIIECTLSAIEDNGFNVDTFYLVGGFGGCNYVHQKVKSAIEELYKSKRRGSCHVIVPPTPNLAIATGAVMWRKDPGKISARRSDATYGISTCQPNMGHDGHCCKLHVFLEKNKLISTDTVLTASIEPIDSNDDNQMFVYIYSTPDVGVKYIVDEDGKSTVTEIGQLVIFIPNPDNLPIKQRMVDITMDFSGTEIKAKAKYRPTGREVNIVCDFLSAQ